MNHQASTTHISLVTGIAGQSLTEQAALAFVREHPACSNRALAKRVGITERGAEEMLSRLRKTGLIRQVGRGRGRRHDLTFPVDAHIQSGKTEMPKSHTECGVDPGPGLAVARKSLPSGMGVVKREQSFDQFCDLHFACFEACLRRGRFDDALGHVKALQERLEEVQSCTPDEAARAMKQLGVLEDRVKVYKWVMAQSEYLSDEQTRFLIARVRWADENRLARIADYVKGNPVLADPNHLIAMLGDGG